MPTLVVVRHAKADRPTGVDDVDRPLLPRGREQARATGEWLRDTLGRPGLVAPGLVVTSPALRTTQTVDGLLAAWPDDPPPVVQDERVYEASLGDLLRVVRGLDDDERDERDSHERDNHERDNDEATIVLVGHNPAVSELVTELTGTAAELRTASAVVLDVPGPWADIRASACRVVARHR